MKKLSVFSDSRWSLRKKLFGYMLALAALLILTLLMGLVIFGQYESIEKKTFDTLDMQMEVFEKDIEGHMDHLAASGIELSEDLGILLDDYLARQNLSFPSLTDDADRIEDIQTLMLPGLKEILLQEDCSGIFMMLDTTVNSSLKTAENSRSGLYLQVNGYDKDVPQNRDLLLYRGLTDAGKSLGIMPHRKWHLEFRSDMFPNYADLCLMADQPAAESYQFTDTFLLPGTSDQVMLLAVPVTGSSGEFYGICGLEISSSYFMTYHAQPSKLKHLTCLLASTVPGEPAAETGSGSDLIYAARGLTCGTSSGYHNPLHTDCSMKSEGQGLMSLKPVSDAESVTSASYIGITRSIRLSPNNPDYTLAVMIPKADFDQASGHSMLKNTLLILLLIFFTVSGCLSFSRRFISPVLRELERLRLENEQTRQQYETAQTEISRLAYSRKTEVDPDAYRQFAESISTLTPTERRIFDYYVAGRTVKEVIALAGIKESTLRYHNQNIYSKLGVNSLKQMLRYAALLQQDDAQTAGHTT